VRGSERHKLISTKTLLSTRGSCCLDDDREDKYLRSNCARRLISAQLFRTCKTHFRPIFGEKFAHVSALYYVNAIHVFSMFFSVSSNLSFNWQSHDKVLCFEIES